MAEGGVPAQHLVELMDRKSNDSDSHHEAPNSEHLGAKCSKFGSLYKVTVAQSYLSSCSWLVIIQTEEYFPNQEHTLLQKSSRQY